MGSRRSRVGRTASHTVGRVRRRPARLLFWSRPLGAVRVLPLISSRWVASKESWVEVGLHALKACGALLVRFTLLRDGTGKNPPAHPAYHRPSCPWDPSRRASPPSGPCLPWVPCRPSCHSCHRR